MSQVKLRLNVNANSHNITYYDVDKYSGLKRVSSTAQSSTNASEIQYGVLANTGSAMIVDTDGTIGELVKDGTIPYHDVDCNLMLNGGQIQHHITNDSDYYEDKVLKLKLENSLSNLANKQFPGMPLTHQTTAFGVLSYIYSTLGFPRENVGVWDKYTYRGTDFVLNGVSNKLSLTTKSGWWEIVGFPITNLTLNQQHTIKFKYTMSAYSALSGYTGIALQVLKNMPENNANSTNALVTHQLSSSAANNKEVTFTFTPTSETGGDLYFVVNFGYAADSQSLEMTINNISLDGKCLSTSTALSGQIKLDNGSIGTIKQHLDNIIIPFPFLETDSYDRTMNKVCEIAQLNLIEDSDGNWTFVSARPIKNNENIVVIPRYLQETYPSDSLFVKNKISKINYSYDKTSRDWDLLHDETLNFPSVSSSTTKTFEGKTFTIQYSETVDMTYRYYYDFYKKEIDGDFLFDSGDLEIYNTSGSGNTVFPSNFFPLAMQLGSNVFRYFNTFDDFVNAYFTLSGSSYKYNAMVNQESYIGDVYGIVPIGDNKYALYGYIFRGYKEGSGSVKYPNPYNIKVYGYKLNKASVSNALTSFDYEMRTNELFQNDDAVDRIINNIVEDYNCGIKTTDMRIKLMDLYYTDGNLAKDYSNGEILDVGDVVRVDKNNSGDSAFIYPNGVDILWKVVGRVFDYSGVPTVTLQLQEVRQSLNNLSWSDINKIAQNGDAEKYLSVGEEKTITLTNGEQITVAIMGFNHDNLATGDGKAGITFGMKNLFANVAQMNGTQTNNGGWEYSIMRTLLNNSLIYFPSDIRSMIKSVKKKNNKFLPNYSVGTVETSDKLWLFSEFEIDGTDHYFYMNEGEQYEYWKKIKDGTIAGNRIKYLANGSGAANAWWLRSINHLGETSFRGVATTGDLSSGYANSEAGMCVGFCI